MSDVYEDVREDFESTPLTEWTLDECWVWLAAQGAINCESALDDIDTARALVGIVMSEKGATL